MKDNPNTPPPKPTSFIRRHKKALIAVSTVVLLLVLAYGIPPLVGDGTGKFSGAKRKVAEDVLQEVYGSQDSLSKLATRFVTFQYYVEDVREMTPDEAKACEYPGDDGTGFYHVEISQVTLFGAKEGRFENFFDSCIASKKVKSTP